MKKPKIPDSLRQETVAYFRERCAYCHSPHALVLTFYEVDHIIPVALGGQTISENLAFACSFCNRYKWKHTEGIDPITGRRTTLFHPRRQNWIRHFRWSESKCLIEGRTACGRATVEMLRMNNEALVKLRKMWLELNAEPPNWIRKPPQKAQ